MCAEHGLLYCNRLSALRRLYALFCCCHFKLGLGTETRYQYGTGTYVTGMY